MSNLVATGYLQNGRTPEDPIPKNQIKTVSEIIATSIFTVVEFHAISGLIVS